MGKDIAPDVDNRIIELCDEETQLTSYKTDDDAVIELHAPFGDDFRVGYVGEPFVAELEYSDTETRVNAIGHFESTQRATGTISVAVLHANYGPLADDPPLSQDETEFVNGLLTNDYNIDDVFMGSNWTDTIYTGKHIIRPLDPDEHWQTAMTIYPDEPSDLNDFPEDADFGTDRRDELVEATITALGEYAHELAGVARDGCYTIRERQPIDVRERAQQLFVDAPPLTQTQAVSWALHELGLSQTRIADLRGKTQPTIHNHLERAATNYVQADLTASAFDGMPHHFQSDVLTSVKRDLAKGAAQRKFDFEKRLVSQRLRCPECGYDAGEWEGGVPDGEWADEPNQFYVGSFKLKGFQNPDDPRHAECPECGHQTSHSQFENEWEDTHGAVRYNGPDYDPAPR